MSIPVTPLLCPNIVKLLGKWQIQDKSVMSIIYILCYSKNIDLLELIVAPSAYKEIPKGWWTLSLLLLL